MRDKCSIKQHNTSGEEKKKKKQKQPPKTFSYVTRQIIQIRLSEKHRRNGDQILSLTEDGKAIYIKQERSHDATCPILEA